MNRRNFLSAGLGLALGSVAFSSAYGNPPEEIALLGNWYVFDYSEEPVSNWDLSITEKKGNRLTINVGGEVGDAIYNPQKKSVVFQIGERRYEGDIRRNDKGVWIMKGISKTQRLEETSTFTAILQKN